MRAFTQHKWPWNDTFRTHNTCVRNFQTCLQHMCPWVLWGHTHNTCDLWPTYRGSATHASNRSMVFVQYIWLLQRVVDTHNTYVSQKSQFWHERLPQHICPVFTHRNNTCGQELAKTWPTTHLAGNGPWNNTSDTNPTVYIQYYTRTIIIYCTVSWCGYYILYYMYGIYSMVVLYSTIYTSVRVYTVEYSILIYTVYQYHNLMWYSRYIILERLVLV